MAPGENEFDTPALGFHKDELRDRCGGVVTLSDSGSTQPCFTECHKSLCGYTQESCKMHLLCEGMALELLL